MGKFGVGGSLVVVPFPDAAGVVVVGGDGAGWASVKVVAMAARAKIKDVQRMVLECFGLDINNERKC